MRDPGLKKNELAKRRTNCIKKPQDHLSETISKGLLDTYSKARSGLITRRRDRKRADFLLEWGEESVRRREDKMWIGDARIAAVGAWLGLLKSKYPVSAKAASKPGFLYEFPWEMLGDWKYVLFLPFVSIVCLGLDDDDDWSYHMLLIAALRYAQVLRSIGQRKYQKLINRFVLSGGFVEFLIS